MECLGLPKASIKPCISNIYKALSFSGDIKGDTFEAFTKKVVENGKVERKPLGRNEKVLISHNFSYIFRPYSPTRVNP
jgi:hypothetical protein